MTGTNATENDENQLLSFDTDANNTTYVVSRGRTKEEYTLIEFCTFVFFNYSFLSFLLNCQVSYKNGYRKFLKALRPKPTMFKKDSPFLDFDYCHSWAMSICCLNTKNLKI